MELTSSTEEDDMLETMLKEAEVLAARMSAVELGKSSAVFQPLVDNSPLPSNSSEHSKLTVRQQSVKTEASDKLDPLLQKAERLVQQVKERNTSPVVEPKASLAQQLAESKESLGQLSDLDEVLRQSEALLQKMRSKNSVASSEINGAATPSKESAEETPSSVYLLRSNSSGVDDVSSVGSDSLRASHSHLMDALNASSDAMNASKLMADSVKEITEERRMDDDPHTPSTPTPSSPDEDRVPVMDYTSPSLVTRSSNSSKDAERPTRSVTSRSSISISPKNAEQPNLQTIIPDFTATASDTQWEKVKSANTGDNDFAPIKDFSSEQRKKVTTQPIIVPSKQSRLETYRGEAKRRKRRQQRTLKVVVIGAVFAILFVWSRSGGDSSTSRTIQTLSESVSLVEEVSETIEEPETIKEALKEEEPIGEPEDVEESQAHDDVGVDAQEEQDVGVDAQEEQEAIVEESLVSVQELDVKPEPTIQVAASEESNAQQEPIDDKKRLCKNLLAHFFNTPCRLFLRARKQSSKRTKLDLLVAALL